MATALNLLAAWRREWQHLRGNRWDMAFITVLPLVCLLLMTWLFSAGVMRQLPVALVDEDHTAQSRLLARSLAASPGLRVSDQPVDMAGAQSLLRSLDVFAIVQIPDGTAARSLRGESAPVYAFYNATYLATGQSAVRDIGDAVNAASAQLLAAQTAARTGPGSIVLSPVSVDVRLLFNPSRNFSLFLLPMVASAVLSLCMAGAVVMAMGREMRQPGQWTLSTGSVLGKLLPYLAVFWLQGAGVLLYSANVDGMGLAGSGIALLAGWGLFLLASAAVGVLLLGLTRDMGVSLSLLGMVLGTALAFSGATFPVLDANLFTRIWNQLLPLTHWLELLNQQLLMGSGWKPALPPLAVLAGMTAVCALVGLKRLSAVFARTQEPAP